MSSERLKELLCVAYIAYTHGDELDADQAAEIETFVKTEQPEAFGAKHPAVA